MPFAVVIQLIRARSEVVIFRKSTRVTTAARKFKLAGTFEIEIEYFRSIKIDKRRLVDVIRSVWSIFSIAVIRSHPDKNRELFDNFCASCVMQIITYVTARIT